MNSSPPASAANTNANNDMSPIGLSAHKRDTSSESGSKRRIPSEQWEAKRGIITQLYQEEKRSLKEVMDILERDHGFNATVKMFKSRIWKWGLDKKLKSDEVLTIMIDRDECEKQGKPFEFTIRDQPVDMDNINRYIKRNPHLVARFRAGQKPSKQTRQEVKCLTPKPDAAAIPTTTATGMSRGFAPMQTHEKDVLLLLKEYIEESFYCGRWRWEYDVSCSTRAADDRSDELFERTLTSLALINRCMARGESNPLGISMLETPNFASLGGMLEPAFAALKELVAVQSPIFATRMLSLLWFLDTHHKSGLLQLIVKQLAKLVVETLGSTHLMARIWRALANRSEGGNPTCDYRELCETAYRTLIPLLERRLGPANKITTMLYGDHVDFLFHGARLDEARGLCLEYKARAEGPGRGHPWIGQLNVLRMTIESAQNDINGAIAAMEMEVQGVNVMQQDEDSRGSMLLRQGNLAMQTGRVEVAVQHFAQAARILASGVEGGDGDVRLLLSALANLEAAQERLGERQAAEGTRGERMRVQGGFAMDTREVAEGMRRARGSIGSESMASGSGGSEGRRPSDVGGIIGMSPMGGTGSEAGWGWSPDVFVSSAGLNDWRF